LNNKPQIRALLRNLHPRRNKANLLASDFSLSCFAELRRELEKYLDKKQIKSIYRAYLLGKQAHEGQTRQSGEPYITHPIAVATILAKMRMDAPTIIAAILHDVIEDTAVDKTTLVQEFDAQVAELVDGVTKLTQIQFESKAEAQAENFRKMVLAMVKDVRVILIKFADRLHNMRTLGSLRPDKRRRIAKETLEIYAPIANRLGMHSLRIDLEDLGFAALYPYRYTILKKTVQKAIGNRREIVKQIETELSKRLRKHKLRPIAVWGRQKHLYSIYHKMQTKHLPLSEIMDVYGFRIIVKNVDACYRTLGAVHSLYKPLPERFKDYIAIPKSNGYQSLHTTLFGPYGVPIEIQVRTEAMDYIAENGIAAHWLYKTNEQVASEAQLRAREWFKSLVEMQQSTGTSLEFIENVKIDLFPDEVYVFTPQGDIIKLPSGATPVDFAYAIHSAIGNNCVAAKVERRLVPLSIPLTSGQTVEIITSPGARPNPAWLNFVVTAKARSSIKHFIKTQHRTEAVEFGKQLLENTLQSMAQSIQTITTKTFNAAINLLGYKTSDELYEAIGLSNEVPMVVAHRLLGIQQNKLEKDTSELEQTRSPLVIKGTEGMMVHFAECCHPLPGESIIGCFTAGEGISVHRIQCHKIHRFRQQQGYCIDVEWAEQVEGEFKVDTEIEVINQRGMLATLARVIADAGANIEDIAIVHRDGNYNRIVLTLVVRDREHLANVVKRVRSIKEVTKLRRKSSLS
jgi:guanosine-3',5'-bis(diphosphate) 3'-pyrophosphohydrolase